MIDELNKDFQFNDHGLDNQYHIVGYNVEFNNLESAEYFADKEVFIEIAKHLPRKLKEKIFNERKLIFYKDKIILIDDEKRQFHMYNSTGIYTDIPISINADLIIPLVRFLRQKHIGSIRVTINTKDNEPAPIMFSYLKESYSIAPLVFNKPNWLDAIVSLKL